MLRAVSSRGDMACWTGGPEAGQAAGQATGIPSLPVSFCALQSSACPSSSAEFTPVGLPHASCLTPLPFPNIQGLCISMTKLRSSPSEAWPFAPLSMDLVVEKRTNISSGTQARTLGILSRSPSYCPFSSLKPAWLTCSCPGLLNILSSMLLWWLLDLHLP